MDGLTEDEVRQVNKFFRVHVTGINYIKPYINRRFTQNGLRNLIGKELADKYSKKALESTDDIPTFKMRRGLKLKYEENLG